MESFINIISVFTTIVAFMGNIIAMYKWGIKKKQYYFPRSNKIGISKTNKSNFSDSPIKTSEFLKFIVIIFILGIVAVYVYTIAQVITATLSYEQSVTLLLYTTPICLLWVILFTLWKKKPDKKVEYIFIAITTFWVSFMK